MAQETTPVSSRRIALVADELLGYAGGGGLGTATSFLALGLARIGHRVEILYFGAAAADPDWARRYEEAAVLVRALRHRDERVEPSYFARPREIALELRNDPPEVVIFQDLGAPGYVALRLRQLGLAFADTLFVVFCHGTRRWITDAARKVRVLPGAHAVTVLEQASIELADVAVSPSAYMVEWMRRQGWQLPAETVVIPLPTSTTATGTPPPRIEGANGRIDRIVFFGRLDPRKGVRLLVAAVNALDPVLLEGIELVFVGRPAPITPGEIEASISERAKQALQRISFESSLGQEEALSLLGRPGTLAVMPSLEDNSPSTVYECLEHGIRFIASDAGGTGELIATADRPQVLFEPTAEGLEAALRRALVDGIPRAAQPAFDAEATLERWADVVAGSPRAEPAGDAQPRVDIVVVHTGATDTLGRCLAALAEQTYADFEVIVSGPPLPDLGDGSIKAVAVEYSGTSVEAARRAGFRAGKAPWVVFLDEDDVPEREFLEALARAQDASGADVVTCGLYLHGADGRTRERFFLGTPRGLGALSNAYGSVGLVRRSLLADDPTLWPAADDPDWPLLTRLSVSGARLVSVPAPLVTRTKEPGTLERNSADALLALEHLERALPAHLRAAARLAAGFAAQAPPRGDGSSHGFARRAHAVLRTDGPAELARRALRRMTRVAS